MNFLSEYYIKSGYENVMNFARHTGIAQLQPSIDHGYTAKIRINGTVTT